MVGLSVEGEEMTHREDILTEHLMLRKKENSFLISLANACVFSFFFCNPLPFGGHSLICKASPLSRPLVPGRCEIAASLGH